MVTAIIATITTPPILAAIAAIASVESPDWLAIVMFDVAEADDERDYDQNRSATISTCVVVNVLVGVLVTVVKVKLVREIG
jgi:hypothetical protein